VANRSPAVPVLPAWAALTALGLCVLGLVLGAYLTYEHYSSATTLSCPNTGAINCLKVTTSTYSKVFGIPVALLGLLYFVAMTALCSPPTWRSADPRVARLRLAGAALGVLFVLYLIWVELFKVNAICLWCTAVHVVTVLLFAVLAFAYASAPRPVPADYEVAR
jgi:uncharacterized membrane protein